MNKLKELFYKPIYFNIASSIFGFFQICGYFLSEYGSVNWEKGILIMVSSIFIGIVLVM